LYYPYGKVQAYIGAELYTKRMFPHGCPSSQKAFVKLFRVERVAAKETLKLLDTRFFTNREGFGFMLANLPRGQYQMHFKKYSAGFDVFDFTARIYSPKNIKLVDDDDANLRSVHLSKETIDKIPSIDEHQKQNQAKEAAAEKKNSDAIAKREKGESGDGKKKSKPEPPAGTIPVGGTESLPKDKPPKDI